jgi:hypothetical protein
VSTSPPLSRRLVLQGAVLTGVGTALAGCAAGTPTNAPPAADKQARVQHHFDPFGTGSDRDVRMVAAAVEDERSVLGDCLGCVAAVPSLGHAIRPLIAQQRQHIAALLNALTDPPHESKARPRPFSGSEPDALTRVRLSLVGAQHRRRYDALGAESGLLARLLASISASHAVAAGLDTLRS